MLRLKSLAHFAVGAAAAAVLALTPNAAPAQGGDPIKIGFGLTDLIAQFLFG